MILPRCGSGTVSVDRLVDLIDLIASQQKRIGQQPALLGDAAIAIYAEEKSLRRAMSIDAAYLQTESEGVLMQLDVQMLQRARAINTWAIIASKGRNEVAGMIEYRSVWLDVWRTHSLTTALMCSFRRH